MIRSVEPQDLAQMCAIYNHYIRNSVATFEEHEVSLEDFSQRIEKITQRFICLVYQGQDKVLAYAYVSPWKERSAYRFSVESSIYVAADAAGQGVGRALYQQLIETLKDYPVATILAGISLPNPASIGLHQVLGFKNVAEIERVGRKFGTWISVAYWQRHIKTEQQLLQLEASTDLEP
ncbi:MULTISPECIES: GNAT family N-acetyltransferase [unclassified Agarivorans]|uniref:GNAT family N-acetyltransferase n=1 Tax=unclassified Agarivorans TaxID=2636026 RepID=UPI003D7E5345